MLSGRDADTGAVLACLALLLLDLRDLEEEVMAARRSLGRKREGMDGDQAAARAPMMVWFITTRPVVVRM